MASEYSEGIYDTLFSFGRAPPLPALYDENKTAVTVDVLEVGWIVAFLTLFISLLFLVPSLACKEQPIFFSRLFITLLIGLVIMLCNYGQEWEVGEVSSVMQYRAGSQYEIEGKVGIKIGLRSVNITLKALKEPEGDLKGENIDYNERFTWDWSQGRRGFGPFANRIQREFREAQTRGIPYPILWIAEYFTFDGEGIRFGRHYRHAGWYSHICIWTAFALWIVTIILFKLVIRYGAIMLSLIGSLLLISSIIWSSVRNFNELNIIFNDTNSGILKTKFGVHWYLALIFGIFCLLAGIIIFILDYWFHEGLCKFFGNNPFAILDEDYEEDVITSHEVGETNQGIEMKDHNKLQRVKSRVRYRPRGAKSSEIIQSEYSDVGHSNEKNFLNVSQAYNVDSQHNEQWTNQTYSPDDMDTGKRSPYPTQSAFIHDQVIPEEDMMWSEQMPQDIQNSFPQPSYNYSSQHQQEEQFTNDPQFMYGQDPHQVVNMEDDADFPPPPLPPRPT